MQRVRQLCRANIAATVQCMIAFVLLGVISAYVLDRWLPDFDLLSRELLPMAGVAGALVGAPIGQGAQVEPHICTVRVPPR